MTPVPTPIPLLTVPGVGDESEDTRGMRTHRGVQGHVRAPRAGYSVSLQRHPGEEGKRVRVPTPVFPFYPPEWAVVRGAAPRVGADSQVPTGPSVVSLAVSGPRPFSLWSQV